MNRMLRPLCALAAGLLSGLAAAQEPAPPTIVITNESALPPPTAIVQDAGPQAPIAKAVEADAKPKTPPTLDDLSSRLEKAEAKLKAADDKAKKDADDKAAKEAEAKAKPLDNKKLLGGWDEKHHFVFADEAKETKIHIGSVVQFDSVWWNESAAFKQAAPAGLGALDDGSSFRRARIKLDGYFYKQFEYNAVFSFEGLNQGFYDHLWFGAKDVPLLGTVRVGQHKIWQGLESIARNEDNNFMERSLLFDAFWQEFGVGVFQTKNFAEERGTFSTSFHRVSVYNGTSAGANYGDGNYATSARATLLPIWRDEGDQYVHLGVSDHYRGASLDRAIGNPLGAPLTGSSIVRYQGRLDLRDAAGVGSPAFGSGIRSLTGNNNRFLDTGNIVADSVNTIGAEFMAVNGPFSVLGEATLATINAAQFPATAAIKPVGTVNFWGAYVQGSYFLTGEHRPYDKRLGVYGKVLPKRNARIGKRDDCHCDGGGLGGAWEILARWTYADLTDKTIQGGRTNMITFGGNWYLNPNMRLLMEYTIGDRTDLPAGQATGAVQGFGTRLHFEF